MRRTIYSRVAHAARALFTNREIVDGDPVTYPRDWWLYVWRLYSRTWTQIRGIGNSPAIRMTVAVPVLGYLILFNETLRSRLNLWHDVFGANLGPALPWRLVCLYFGLTAVAIGSLIYQWRCPQIIKRYDGPLDYIGAVEARGSDQMRTWIRERVMIDPRGKMLIDEAEDTRRRRLQEQDPKDHPPLHTDFWRTVLSIDYVTQDQSRPTSRAFAIALYYPGFGLIAIPSIDVLVRVVLHVARSMF